MSAPACTRALALATLLPALAGFDLLQRPNRAVDQGNDRMKGGKAEEALAEYDKAVRALPADPGVRFNRGVALFQLSRHGEAVEEFLRATEARSPALKAAAFYNLGNTFFKGEKYSEAVEAYRRSLAIDPTNLNAKWNLEIALKKKVEEERKKQEQDKQKKDDEKKQDQKDDKGQQDRQDRQEEKEKQQQQKEQKQSEQKGQDQQKGRDQQDQGKQEQQQQQQQDGKGQPKPAPDMREIEAVLDSLEKSPKNLEQERARLRAVRRAAPAKDW